MLGPRQEKTLDDFPSSKKTYLTITDSYENLKIISKSPQKETNDKLTTCTNITAFLFKVNKILNNYDVFTADVTEL